MPARIRPRRPIKIDIAAWRESRGLTQAQLAARLGTNDMTVSRWERGVVQMTVDTVVAIAEALDVEPADMFRSPDTLSQQNEALNSALAALENLRRR